MYSCSRVVSSWNRYGTRPRDFEVVQLAKRCITDSAYRVLRDDKDGGYCVVPKLDVPLMQSQLQRSLFMLIDIVKDMGRQELVAICRCGIGSARVYLYDVATLSVSKPGPEIVAWPVEYALGH